MDTLLKRLTYTLLLGSSLVVVLSPTASAHEPVNAQRATGGHRHAAIPLPVYPRWLRRDRAFQRWYVRSHYRHMRRLSWRRLYRLYNYDVAYYRRGGHYYPYRQWESGQSNRRRARSYRGSD